jgi:ABC-type transport system involved in multi-copper enzyme maturation permease subunit
MKSEFKFWSFDWPVIRLMMEQSLRSVGMGWGAYVVWALGFTGVLLVFRNTLGVIRTGYATVLSEPLVIPVAGMAVVIGLFMAFLAGLSIARERELGTLETLFYGPIHYRDYILGKILGYWAAYGIVMIVFLLVCTGLAWVVHLTFSPLLLLIGLFTVCVAVSLVGWGVLAAAIMNSVRGTLFFLLGLMIIFLGLPLGSELLTSAVSSQTSLNLIVLRDSFEALTNIISLFSPIAYLLNGIDTLMRASRLEFLQYLAFTIVYGTATIVLATWLFRRKGAVR